MKRLASTSPTGACPARPERAFLALGAVACLLMASSAHAQTNAFVYPATTKPALVRPRAVWGRDTAPAPRSASPAPRIARAASAIRAADAPADPPPMGPAGRRVADAPALITTPSVPPAANQYALDLTTALRLTEVENPEIAEARQRILEALALQQGARALLLPSLNAGFTYHGHTGNLQRSTGQILSESQQLIYLGGGASTVAAVSIAVPAVLLTSPLADALYQPLAARQNVDRRKFENSATTNAVLLDAAVLYFELAAAEAGLNLQRQTESDIRHAAQLTTSYAKAGQGYVADADRASTLMRLVQRGVERSEEEVSVASTRLARRLHLDPAVALHPLVPGIAPIDLVNLAAATEDLVQAALRNRPEMGAQAAAIAEAETRLRAEYHRPLLPTVWLGFSGGAFGGGSNIVPPLLGNVSGRTDFDVRLYWTLQNMGMGNLALQKTRRALLNQAVGDRSRTIATIRREVAAARGDAISARGRVDVTARQLATSEAGFREDLDRLRNTVGRPIELTNSLELLSQARLDHLRAILDYDRAQIRLFVALGSPPPLERPATDPLPPAPIANPPLPLPAISSTALPPLPGSGSVTR